MDGLDRVGTYHSFQQIGILTLSMKECIFNFLGESNFFNFNQVFAKIIIIITI
jgi:hypothetical protein